jgi:hypothetical protein
MIINVCPRCHSEQLNLDRQGYYGCASCGKAGKSYEVELKILIDGDTEVHYLRNIMREMAGTLSEYTAPQLASGLARLLEHYKVSVSPNIAREIISRTVSESFQALYQMTLQFLPPKIQEDVQLLNGLIMREQEAAQKKEGHHDGTEQGGEPAPKGDDVGGDVGGEVG